MSQPIYYHVRVSESDQQHDEVRTDLDEDALERQFLAPYRNGDPITISGRTIPIEKLARIRVSASRVPASVIENTIRAEDAQSSVLMVGGPDLDWRAAARADDVTDQFITGPPGYSAPPAPTVTASPSPGSPRAPNSVFLIRGRDAAAAQAMTQYLRALGLQVVEWEHAVARTGQPSPYVGEVVMTGLSMAGAAVVLLTPDDLVQLRPDLTNADDPVLERETCGQARPNVFYEAGIADALARERTVIVEIGNVKPFSDVSGRHVVRYDGSAPKRNALAERLRVAGLTVNTSGTDWLGEGDVTPSIEAADHAIKDTGAAKAGGGGSP